MKNKHHYHYDNSHERIYLNQFGDYLLEQADKDYIASRALYRRELIVHSANLAHQCVEKYLKAVLLYIGKSTRDFSHNIDELRKISVELGTDLGEDSIKAIKLLNGLHNVSRYAGSGSYSVNVGFIYYLDYFVRDIRPYAQNRNLKNTWKVESNIKRIKSGHEYKASGILFNGYLEKVLSSKAKNTVKIKNDLVWNNPFFGSKNKEIFYSFTGSTSRNFPINLESSSGQKMAKHVANFFRFEPEIEKKLKKLR